MYCVFRIGFIKIQLCIIKADIKLLDILYIAERRLDQCPDRALLVWSPTADIPDQKCK